MKQSTKWGVVALAVAIGAHAVVAAYGPGAVVAAVLGAWALAPRGGAVAG